MTIQTYKVTKRTVDLTNEKAVVGINIPDMLTCTRFMATNFKYVTAAI